MLHYFKKRPYMQWALLAMLILIYPAMALLVCLTGNEQWLSLSILAPLAGMLGISLIAGNSLTAITIIFILLAGLREADSAIRGGILFYIPVMVLTWFIAYIYRYRTTEKELGYERSFSELEEKLTLVREQYKTDLVVNVSNQKKFQKYSLLNRVSRVFGSQLQLGKLADKVVQEVQEIMGAERGSYFLALDFPDKTRALIRGIPEEHEIKDIMQDQYGKWAIQHRSALLVPDTNDDFRFQSPGSNTMVRSLMLIPMQSEGHVTGVLRAEGPGPNIFTSDDLRLFTIIADLASVAAENARLYQYARELAITDGLTGLYLRRFFNQRLEEELGRFQEHATPFSLLILDLDHFKRINDRRGHLAGDQILAQIGETLRTKARVADLLCRFGGEEFAIILPNTNLESALIMAERIRFHVAQHEFTANGEVLHLTISVGIGECPRHGVDMNELIRVTDEALYLAKREGRNRVMLAGSLS